MGLPQRNRMGYLMFSAPGIDFNSICRYYAAMEGDNVPIP